MNKALSLLRKALKATLWVVGIFVLLFMVLAVVIQIPAVQTKIVHYATGIVSNKTHTRVEIRNVSIGFPKSVVLKGLFLEDTKKDTLIYVGEANINIALYDLLFNKIDISSLALNHVSVHLYNTPSDSLFNYNFLIKAFASTAPVDSTTKKKTAAWKFIVDNVKLQNIRLRYDDAFGGMNVNVRFDELKLKMNKIDLDKSIYQMDDLLVENLQAKLLLKESNRPKSSQSTGILPTISANNIQINHSTVNFEDLTGNQSVHAIINRLELKKSLVDLETESVHADKIYLSKSNVQYSTSETTKKPSPTTVQLPSNWKVAVKNIDLADNSLTYNVENTPVLKNAFDANHLYFRYFNLKAKDINYSTAKTEAVIQKFNAIDRNNFIITKFETRFSMDEHSITAKNLTVGTTHSSVNASVNLQYSSLQSIKDSLQNLVLNVDMKKVSIQNADILYFNPALAKQPFLQNKTNRTTISGILTGTLNNLSGKNLKVETGKNTMLTSNFTVVGLPNVQKASFNFPDLKLVTGKKDLEMLGGSSYIPKSVEVPENISLDVIFKGNLKAFESTIGLKSSFGDGKMVASIDKSENFKANLDIPNFDVGSLLKDKTMYGPVSLTAEINGHGLDKNTLKANVKADVTQIYLNQYLYHNLKVDGTVSGREFAGKINLNDKNAMLDFAGVVNMTPNEETYQFNLNVQGIDLQKLNFTKDDMRISLNATADMKGGTISNLNGKAGISKMIIAHGDKKYMLDSLLAVSVNEPHRSEINVNSSIIGIKYTGKVSPVALPAALNQFINRYFLLSDTKPVKGKNEMQDFNFEIQLRNNPILSEVFFPELKEFVPGIITGSYDSLKSNLRINANIPKLVYGTTEINDLALEVSSDSSALNYKLSTSSITNPQVELDNFLFDGKLSQNKLLANFSSISDDNIKKLVIHAQITKDKNNYKLALDPKEFYLMNNRWDIAADNYLEFGKQGFLIHHLFINHDQNQINIASVHDKFNDDLNVAIKNFSLDDISQIVQKDTSLIKGYVDGNVLLKRVNNSYGIVADAQIRNLIVRDVPIGNVDLKANNPTSERFDIDLTLNGNDNKLTASGYLIPNGGSNSINIKTNIESLSMKTVEAFSMGQISQASGKVTGNILVNGATSAPEITGELVLDNAFMNPAVLNNRLEFKHEKLQLKTDGIYLNNFTMYDAAHHSATIDGTVHMKQFKDFIFALQINTKNFLLMNTTAKDNKEFFGRMIIDSKIDVKGPMSLPVVTARLKMKKGSNFTFAVPEDKLTADKGDGVVEFNDTLKLNPILNKKEIKTVEKTGFTGFDLSSVIEIDKEATLRLLMDPASSDSLVVRGEAALSFTMDRSGKMSLTGAYNLNEGSYLVSLQSVIKKKFEIVPGSTIIWNGEPTDAEININATFTQRAAPIDLVADQMSGLSETDKAAYKQPYPFLVVLKLRGAILRPEISFEIQLPPENKGILGGAVNQKLNMLNEDASALNKQVFALLILGRFVQENPLTTETGGTEALVRSTVGTFLSTELNKLSSKVVPGVEMNFNIQSYNDYQSGTSQGRTQVEIGLKKQLFNDRLSVQVGGAVDVEGAKAQQNSASQIAGDVVVEYKLTKDGRFLLKAFRHNQYEGAIEGQLVETGAGVVYVRDFNKWKNFFVKPVKKKALKPKTTPKP